MNSKYFLYDVNHCYIIKCYINKLQDYLNNKQFKKNEKENNHEKESI